MRILKKEHFHAEMVKNMPGAPPDLWCAHLFGMDRIPTGLVWENSLRGRLQEKESKRRSSIKIQESPSLFITFSLRQFGVFCTVSREPQEAKARVSFNQLSQTPSRPSTGCPIDRGLIITVQSIKTIPVERSALSFPSKPRHLCPHLLISLFSEGETEKPSQRNTNILPSAISSPLPTWLWPHYGETLNAASPTQTCSWTWEHTHPCYDRSFLPYLLLTVKINQTQDLNVTAGCSKGGGIHKSTPVEVLFKRGRICWHFYTHLNESRHNTSQLGSFVKKGDR